MSCETWTSGPFGVGAHLWSTGEGRRTVLVVVHSITAATRLADVTPLFESDLRVQTLFTHAPSSFPGGVDEYLRRLGVATVPWAQAVRESFDLAIAASYGRLEQLHAPVLTLSHGIGYGKYPERWEGYGPPGERSAWGLERQQLLYHGRVVPAAIVLPHYGWLSQLERSCPEAVPAAVIAGDPAYDRLTASLLLRDEYRRALDIADGRKLVVVSSTWGSQSLLARRPDLVPWLLDELPQDEYRVALILHPNIWHWHGPWQVRAWYADCIRRGLALIPPEEGWRATLVAGDRMIGDHGSVTYYAAAVGVPTLLGAYPDNEIDPASQVALLGKVAPRIRWDEPWRPQLENVTYPLVDQETLANRVTSVPGRSGWNVRAAMYRLMGLPEPHAEPRLEPVPAPRPVEPPSVPELT